MSNQDKLDYLARFNRKNRKTAEEEYKRQSKRRLQKAIDTKFNTAVVGAIAAIEKSLGYLWGEGKPLSELTPRERAMREVKEELRTEIFNNGNNQKRAALAEINQYIVEWKRYEQKYSTEEGTIRYE